VVEEVMGVVEVVDVKVWKHQTRKKKVDLVGV
jgi:hypothetical protein